MPSGQNRYGWQAHGPRLSFLVSATPRLSGIFEPPGVCCVDQQVALTHKEHSVRELPHELRG